MSARDPPNPFPNSEDAPGAFPDSPHNGEDVPLSSDLYSISRAVKARRSEYTRQRQLRVKVGTWNVAALSGIEDDVRYWFVKRAGLTPDLPSKPFGDVTNQPFARSESVKKGHKRNGGSGSWVDQELVGRGSVQLAAGDPTTPAPRAVGDDIDIYVLGLQEIVDVSSPSEALRPYVDPAPSNRWKEAVQQALPPGYVLISSQQLVGLLLLVYASPAVAPAISSVSSVGVGTGLMGYMGNKGGVATRIVVGGTTRLVFVNCHLAAGADKGSLDRRNWDAGQIMSRTKFEPVEEDNDIVEEDGNAIGYEEFGFFFGDLNYRLEDIPGDDVRRLLHLHTGNKFHAQRSPAITEENSNTASPTKGGNGDYLDSTRSSFDIVSERLSPEPSITMEDNSVIEPLLDPASLATTLTGLLPHDQLHRQQMEGNVLYDGWREARISFLPTYKYDIGTTGRFDSSEKQRGPSWCDRILFRTRHHHAEYKQKLKEAEDARKKDERMKSLGLDQEAEADRVLFDYDPDLDGHEYDERADNLEPPNPWVTEDTESKDIQVTAYASHQEIVSSDHKPLEAEFILTFDAVDKELKAKVHQEVVRELDKAENESRPGVTIVVENQPEGPDEIPVSPIANDPNAVNFGQVKFDVPVSRSLTVANTSGVPATFSFHYRPSHKEDESSPTSPPWLHLQVDGKPDGDPQNPKPRPEYTLQPGETTNVLLSLCIYQIGFVRELNSGNARVEDILVLRVTNGRDYFIPVYGTWLTSCFGFSLEDLTQMPEEGARHLENGAKSLYSTEYQSRRGTRTSAPRELFRLTETVAELTERAVAEWGMTGDNNDSKSDLPPWSSEKLGWPFKGDTWTYTDFRERYRLLSRIRDALDTNEPLTSVFPLELPSRYRVELICETLLLFLSSINGGIISPPLWQQLEQQAINREKSKLPPLPTEQAQSQILEVLSSSPAHSVSFTFVTFMLNRVANEIAPLPPAASQSTPLSPTFPNSPISMKPPSISEASMSDSLWSTPSSPATPTGTLPAPPPPSGNAISRTFSLRLGKARNRDSLSGLKTETSSLDIAAAANATTAAARRQAVNNVFAKIFVEAIFWGDMGRPEKEKERRVWEERRKAILEPFLE
ncbi:hypothetical protein AJ79_00630 [Helicocarpus griseus UAMH5409]|uniref:Inositol polyphosphate-related phosphatase domain-containing protein n=1 Tax=Helicocarpus griseus UAMH5409 TaxID=1447875 RepID=A0A2B7YB55_9EURO|nr:hypothetical protein AJ79_00630 [Helicocarpus griseus UAMH5409]